jgi:hypothetical protein
MSRKKKDAYAIAHVKLLDHLNQNLKEADADDTYRRREIYRTQIALESIQRWMDEAEEYLSLDKNKK